MKTRQKNKLFIKGILVVDKNTDDIFIINQKIANYLLKKGIQITASVDSQTKVNEESKIIEYSAYLWSNQLKFKLKEVYSLFLKVVKENGWDFSGSVSVV